MSSTKKSELGPEDTWGPGHIRTAGRLAIMIAVEINTRMPHPEPLPLVDAARHLGACGSDRASVLRDLVGMLAVCDEPIIPTVQRALEAHEDEGFNELELTSRMEDAYIPNQRAEEAHAS